jgi:XTP/dITP diphosphohydrolase
MRENELIVASNNSHKLSEISSVLYSKFNILSLDDLGFFDEIEEYGTSFEENARIKSETIYTQFKRNVMSDDSGLEIDALDGRPGVFSARFAGKKKDDEANVKKVLKLLENIENRAAKFTTVISLFWQGDHHLFSGHIEGKIINEQRGKNGFGYDPIFVPKGEHLTFAEMTSAKKNEISHRKIALTKMASFLSSNSK